ncbi:ABC transporter ATP-binding protein [Brevibacillus halotolerans]|uniref:ATP-binding cassette domain-containing protein n=1 Tax=Brevibacillus TaxID=55080 RepID=UPI00215C80D3|nr:MULTISPECIES: ABC transporter ATP-binding protein [Brevibacillus]MCR8963567.1 ABC transporter ATP-binding protein/permease [Brevibacillus laterosporus]MCZ0835723.1 ABC transporter ATP-binding protein [Brevibacillus halotolerans]
MRHRQQLFLYACKIIWNFNKTYMLLVCSLSIILALQSNAIIVANKYTIDNLVSSQIYLALLGIGIMLFLELLQETFELFLRFYNTKCDEQFGIYREQILFDKLAGMQLLEREHPSFLGKIQVWSLGLMKIQATFQSGIQCVKALLTGGISIYVLVSGYWLIGAIIIGFSLVKSVFVFKVIDPLVSMNLQMARAHNLSTYFRDLLVRKEAQKEFLLFQAFSFFKEKWLDAKTNIMNMNIEITKLNVRPEFISNLLTVCSRLMIMVMMVFLVVEKRMTIGDFVAISLAASLAERNILSLFLQCKNLLENLRYVDEYQKLDLITPSKRENQAAITDFQLKQGIEVIDLTFTYPNREEPALHKINLSIKKGEKIAIIGDNAAGKSTLIKLLLGLYQAPDNTIFYDGVEQKQLDVAGLWKSCGAIFQDFMKYKVSIQDNICLGNERKDDQELYHLLEHLNIQDFYRLKNGLSTKLGDIHEDSVDLSGGQWQRIALARLLYRNLDLMVLDEPTSALDPNSEVKVFDDILELAKDKTLFIISHRIGIGKKVDRIYYMRQGSIIEQGTHQQLMDAKGEYYRTWERQSEWYNSELVYENRGS